jgi:hypothetical protein
MNERMGRGEQKWNGREEESIGRDRSDNINKYM